MRASRAIFASIRKTRSGVIVPWLLAGFAVAYYSLYATAGLNLGGEGGTAGVVAMRLMAGQRPIVDTFLGYNVMWFFPVAWIFEITGPNYLVLRWYFFAFCIASGLLTYFVVQGYTKNPWYSAVPAVLVILVPGMIFRNYMPFLGILNAFLLTRAFVFRHARGTKSFAWMLAAGIGLGITFLFRIDLGAFFTLIFLGLTFLFPLGERGKFWSRCASAIAGATGGLVLAWAVHVPVWNHAQARGYDRAFLDQYGMWLGMIVGELRQQAADLAENGRPHDLPSASAATRGTVGAPPSAAVQKAPAEPKKPAANSWEDRGALARVPLRDAVFGKKWTQKSFAISTYLPLAISAIAIAVGGIGLLAAIVRRDPDSKVRFLYPLTVLGCSLALLPQFLFFRPDTPHLSEMMVPFVAALALLFWASAAAALKSKSRWGEIGFLAFAALCMACAGIYFSHAFPKESAGTIAAKKEAAHEFRALNGVSVKVRARDAKWLAGLRDAVLTHARPGEYVLCLPYSPTINFMTDRPSPLHNLYVDNTFGEPAFSTYFLGLVSSAPPAVVVIDERKINSNEISRFKNWSPNVYAWLWSNYAFAGRYGRNEVFVRPDKASAGRCPEYIEVIE